MFWGGLKVRTPSFRISDYKCSSIFFQLVFSWFTLECAILECKNVKLCIQTFYDDIMSKYKRLWFHCMQIIMHSVCEEFQKFQRFCIVRVVYEFVNHSGILSLQNTPAIIDKKILTRVTCSKYWFDYWFEWLVRKFLGRTKAGLEQCLYLG